MEMEQLDISDEEVAFLIIQYLHDANQQGREYVPLSEIFTYLECEMPEDIEDIFLTFQPEMEEYFQEEKKLHRKRLN